MSLYRHFIGRKRRKKEVKESKGGVKLYYGGLRYNKALSGIYGGFSGYRPPPSALGL